MNVLDENIVAEQRELLRRWRIPFRRIGEHLAVFGALDENLIPVLHRLPQPTFFTSYEDFFEPTLCHANYALVYLDVDDRQTAAFLRRFLRHSAFNTRAKRLGIVARVHADGVQFWRNGISGLQTVEWEK